MRALAREQVLDRARTVRRTVLAGFRNDEWHAVGARVLVGARVRVGFNGSSLGRTIHVRLSASLDARLSGATPTQWPPTRPHYHCNGRCEEIKKNRIFETGTVTDGYDLKHLKPGVMYYCLEDKEKKKFDCYGSDFAVTTRKAGNWPSHPRADLFYLTGTGGQGPGGSTGLTLVDITGATGAATQKRKNLADWIEFQSLSILTGFDERFHIHCGG